MKRGERVEVEEIIKLKSMLKIPSEISRLEYELKHVSKNYFQEHSLIGGMMKDEFLNYTSPIDPFTATACIISEENTLKNKIKRYRERFRLFADEFTTEELNTLKRAINANESHPIIEVAVEWLKEVEFYITTRAESLGEQWINNEKPTKANKNDTVQSDSTQIGIAEFNALEEEFERMVSEWK